MYAVRYFVQFIRCTEGNWWLCWLMIKSNMVNHDKSLKDVHIIRLTYRKVRDTVNIGATKIFFQKEFPEKIISFLSHIINYRSEYGFQPSKWNSNTNIPAWNWNFLLSFLRETKIDPSKPKFHEFSGHFLKKFPNESKQWNVFFPFLSV